MTMAPLRTALCGLLAGAIGTLAMDLVWFARYKRGGGKSDFVSWETGAGLSAWDDASAPARAGKLLYEALTRRELPATRVRLTTNVMHWGYGPQWGAVLAVALGSSRFVRFWHAPLLAGLVWLAGYFILPVAGVYKPIWSYDVKTLWDDFSAHLVYGAGVVAGYWKLCRD